MNDDNKVSWKETLLSALVLAVFLYSGLSLLSIIENNIRNFAGIYSLMIFSIILIESLEIKEVGRKR